MKLKKVVLRSWPKMLFTWPSALAALGAGLVTEYDPLWMNAVGLVFILVVAANAALLTFDFPRAVSLALLLGSVGLISTSLLLNQRYGFFLPLQYWISTRSIHGSPQLYYALAGVYGVGFVAMVLKTRFDYWVLTPNELIHRTGWLADRERFSTSGLKLKKEIPDVFEYLLFGAGRIVLTLPGAAMPVVLENVLGTRTIEKFAASILDARLVRLDDGRRESA